MQKNTSSNIGDHIDHFQLEEEIGRGGFGVVYRASQVDPVSREVALKILKAGMDSQEIITRFEGERQALAMMDHQGIAKVFDAGLAPSGRPYFVMELVRGSSITKFCNDNELDTRERLELVCEVCSAIQHAHQRGIIHRDLKPSNILVSPGQEGNPPRIKIIDFGIAKAIEEKFTEQTLVTALGQMLGTPQYMSPEQAGGTDQDIDTRCDIYSLGVILYELLTGSPPLSSEKLRSASFSEMHHMICEEIPPRPSARITNTLTKSSENTTLRELRRRRSRLASDLDWVILKALEKDRERRYASAAALSDDLLRHLNHEAVLASPPSRIYKLRKFIRRNPASTIAAALILIGLLITLGALTRERAAIEGRNAALARQNELLMESKIHMASMASQKGNWQETIRVIDDALTFQETDLTQLKLDKLRALVAVNRVADARHLLTEIIEQKEVNSKFLGSISLWQAEFAMIQEGSTQSKALIKQAIKQGLSEEDKHYAEGLLAKNSLEKLKCFKKSLAINSFHHSSTLRLTQTLILLGRFEEAENQLRFIQAAFPQDTSHDILLAMIYALRGNDKAAQELWQSRSLQGSMDAEAARLIIDSITLFRNSFYQSWDTGNTMQGALLLKGKLLTTKIRSIQGKKTPLKSSLYSFQAEEFSDSFGAILLAFPDIQLMKFPKLNTGKRAVDRLEKAAANHPECLMHFICGVVSIAYAENSSDPAHYNNLARESFKRAAQLPSIIPDLPKEATYGYGMMLALKLTKDLKNKDLRVQMLSTFRKRISMGKPFKQHQLSMIFDLAKSSNDTSLCQSVIKILRKQYPDNPEYIANYAKIENQSGNFVKSLQLAREALIIQTDDKSKVPLQKLIEKNLKQIRAIGNE